MEHQMLMLKLTASSVGASLSSFILLMFALPWPAFMAGFIGSFIGELLREKTSFKKTAITIGTTSIMAAFVGSMFIAKLHTYPPTGILAIIGFILSYQRDFILKQITSIIKTFFDKIKSMISDWKSSDKDEPK